MTTNLEGRARELIYRLQEHVTVGETFKGGACTSWTYDKCVALIEAHDTQVQAEARLAALEEAAQAVDGFPYEEVLYHDLRDQIALEIRALTQAAAPATKEG